MTSMLQHRGPDQGGIALMKDATLAMCRLGVIDLEGGRQPMSNENGSCCIVYNGEVYNFMDLRRTLEARGWSFRTRSDTETVLRSYEEWGPDCVQRLRGMFAFAIYDGRPDAANGRGNPPAAHGYLFLARDRVGKKPLYYYHDAERFVFASEIKAIVACPGIPRRVNRRVLPLYLAHGYVPTPYTMFEDIYEVPPGHTLTVRDGCVTVQQYWDVAQQACADGEVSERQATGQLRQILEEAVRIRLMSDVPLGAFLSGGVDSAAIVALMARLGDRPVKTFAIGFEGDASFNELGYARRVARAYGTDHREFVVGPDAVDLLPKLVWQYDQPSADSSAIPTYLVSKLTREHVTVVLTGDGGDELFAGYERFAAARLAEVYRRTPRFMRRGLEYLIWLLPEATSYNGFVRRARRFVENAPLPLAQRYLGWVGIFNHDFIRELLAGDGGIDPVRHFEAYFDQVQEVDPLGQLLYVNAKTYLPGDLLVKTDRMTMANSLEARCPFLDQELLQFAAGIPSRLKLRGLTTKYILRKAMEGLVPPEILRRKKHGFGVPVGRWFRRELKDYVREILLSPQALGRGYFRVEALHRLIEQHQDGQRDHGHRLWALLTFEMWHRLFIDREISP